MKKSKKNDKGFTLVELVVVIAILGVLIGLIVPKILGNVGDAKRNTEVANARTLASDISVYNAKCEKSSDWIQDGTDTGTTIDASEYDDHLVLPDGLTWPSGTYASIKVDSNGNASVNIVGPTPTTKP